MFVTKQKKHERGGRLKVKIPILIPKSYLFYGDKSWTNALTVRQMKFDIVKHHGHTYKFYVNHCFVFLFDEASKYGNGAKC